MPVSGLNFRDIGGLPTQGGRTREGVLFRSEGPRNFSPAQLDALRGVGFRTIVDLRSAGERADMPHDWHGAECRLLGLDVNADLRVFGNDGKMRLMQGPEPEIAIDTMVEAYREIVAALVPHWGAIAGALLAGSVPVLLNCTAGKDRTGVAIAFLLEMAGVPREVIMDDYLRSNIFGENLVRDGGVERGFRASYGFLPSPGQVQALIGVRSDYLEAAWDEVAKGWSGLPGYLAAAGLDAATQDRIAAVLAE